MIRTTETQYMTATMSCGRKSQLFGLMDDPFSGTSKRTRVREYFKPKVKPTVGMLLGAAVRCSIRCHLRCTSRLRSSGILSVLGTGNLLVGVENKRVKARIVPRCWAVRRRKGGTYPLSHLYGYFGLVRLCRLGHDVPCV